MQSTFKICYTSKIPLHVDAHACVIHANTHTLNNSIVMVAVFAFNFAYTIVQFESGACVIEFTPHRTLAHFRQLHTYTHIHMQNHNAF